MAAERIFLGVDVGGTNVKIGPVTSTGKLLGKEKQPTILLKKGNFVQNMFDFVEEQLQAVPGCQHVGIGLPGLLSKDRRTALEFANLPELNNTPLVKLFEKRFSGVTVHLENDANAAALGEWHFGSEKLPEHFIFVTLGTGVGGAAVVDGKIFKGGFGNSMELGHMIVDDGQTLEQHIGKAGLVEHARHLISKDKVKTKLRDNRELTAKLLEKAVFDDDEVAVRVFRRMGKYLGQGMASVIRVLDIHTIVVGGGVADTMPYMKEAMFKQLDNHLPSYYSETMDIRLASLKNNAGIIGAASLCFE